jgi:hypothetical protein
MNMSISRGNLLKKAPIPGSEVEYKGVSDE